MKKITPFIILVLMSLNSFGQFPSPTNFSVIVEYVEMDGMGWTDCGGTVLYAPAYCTRMSWSAPDTNSIVSSLIQYNVYQDSNLLFSVDKNVYGKSICGALTGNFYVTASYTNPEGESDTSNLVFISDELPIGIADTPIDKEFTVLYNSVSQKVEILNRKFDIESIALYDLNGKLVVISKNMNQLTIPDLNSGIYIFKITDRQRRTQNEKIKIN